MAAIEVLVPPNQEKEFEKMYKAPLDPRSTQRKRARKILFAAGLPFICVDCGKSPDKLPVDAPQNLELASVGMRTLSSTLQANHINKNIMDNDLANLEWLCNSCHKRKDQKTPKGVSIINDEHGYGLDIL